MGIQRNLKGRHTAVFVTEQIGRIKKRPPSRSTLGHQQFGGVGSVSQLDQGAAHLSRRAREALLKQAIVIAQKKKKSNKGSSR